MIRITNSNYAEALRKGWFETAIYVWLDNLPGLTALPDMPAATYVWLNNLPGVTALPIVSQKCRLYRNGILQKHGDGH